MPLVIARTAWTDDSGAGTDGTVINNNAKTSLYEQIDAVLSFLSTEKSFFDFPFSTFAPLAASPASPEVFNASPVLAFDPSTDTNVIFDAIMPLGYNGGPLTASVRWAPTTTSTGNCRWDLSFMRRADGVDNIGVDSFATPQSVASPALGTSGLVTYASIPFTSAQIDSLAAGESFRLKLTRNASTAADSLTGNARVFGLSLREN